MKNVIYGTRAYGINDTRVSSNHFRLRIFLVMNHSRRLIVNINLFWLVFLYLTYISIMCKEDTSTHTFIKLACLRACGLFS